MVLYPIEAHIGRGENYKPVHPNDLNPSRKKRKGVEQAPVADMLSLRALAVVNGSN